MTKWVIRGPVQVHYLNDQGQVMETHLCEGKLMVEKQDQEVTWLASADEGHSWAVSRDDLPVATLTWTYDTLPRSEYRKLLDLFFPSWLVLWMRARLKRFAGRN